MTELPPEIHLVESEHVATRGTARTSWFLRRARAWVKATEWPGATLEERDRGPGTVWERAVVLRLPPGTELMRVDVEPRPIPRTDPLSHLVGGSRRAAKTTRRLYYTVTERGRLSPRKPGD